jgi:hypothetical protein
MTYLSQLDHCAACTLMIFLDHEHDPAEHLAGVHLLVSQHGLLQRQHLAISLG